MRENYLRTFIGKEIYHNICKSNNDKKIIDNNIYINLDKVVDIYLYALIKYIKLKKIDNICSNSIKSIDEKLKRNREPFKVLDEKFLNEYQIVRLKAFRQKSRKIKNIIDYI